MRILVDMDNIIVDWLGACLELFDMPPHYKERADDYSMAGLFTDGHWEMIDEAMHRTGWWIGLPFLAPNVLDILRGWKRIGYEVIILSHPWCAESAAGKHEWVKRRLPFLGPDHLVLAKHKHWLNGDILIDDRSEEHTSELQSQR